ncbi:SH3 domain-containing protein [Salana multivorans]
MNRTISRLLVALFVTAGFLVAPAAHALPSTALTSALDDADIEYVNVRSGPGTEFPVVDTIPAGIDFEIGCWVDGGEFVGIYGATTIWYQLDNDPGRWVTDGIIWTGSNEPVTEPCSFPAPSIEGRMPQPDTTAEATVAGAAGAESSVDNDWVDLFDCTIVHGWRCTHALDARNWAFDVTDWKYPDHSAHNDEADAFRHCTWTGAMATRLDQSGAYYVGYVHEINDSAQPDAEEEMDLWNNFIGAGLGAKAKELDVDDQWGYVLEHCETLARNGELYGLDGVKGDY